MEHTCVIIFLVYRFLFNIFLYFSFFMYFVVLAWVNDVNNFLSCESRMMSFDRKMLLPMYRIESSKPAITENYLWISEF
jgi:hypothetical protein